jgi:hypothetical protein
MKHGWTLVRLRGASTRTLTELAPIPRERIAAYALEASKIWCGNQELHPDDLLGRQTCWLLNITAAEIGVRPG